MAAVPELIDTRIRPMTADDVDAVMSIEVNAYPFPWTEGIVRDCLRVGYSCWVMESLAGIHGYAFLSIVAEDCHVLNVCINPEFQGLGLGRELMRYLLEVAGQHGAERCFLEVRPSNGPARHLYRTLGFREIGHRKGYYPDDEGREDAIVLALDIVPLTKK
ncbi:MAG: ribosomal protein S18-alanine N-acetyltransferase [Gammaproteobacteria bacterium]